MQPKENIIPSVLSTLRVLELLMKGEFKSATLTEISQQLSINKSTCLRILKTLQQKDFVHFDEHSKRYQLGSFLVVLGNRAKELNDFLHIAISYLPKIRNELDHTIVLAQPANDLQMIYVAKEEPLTSIRLTISVGELFPIHSGSVGKCYLAYQSPETVDKMISQIAVDGKLPRYTPNSITDIDTYLDSLRKIRENGVAISHSEYIQGVSGVSCPIFNSKGEVLLTLAIFFSSFLVDQIDLKHVEMRLKKFANEISELISHLV